nr:reverse transcriptase domain-containing protein [Tanacetum cinerariifolium]
SYADPTLLNDFELATDRNGDPPVPDLWTMEELYQLSLNGRGGTFMKRRPKECYDLIENMTAHHNDWDTLAQRTTVGQIQSIHAIGAYQGGNSYQPQGASHGPNPPPAYQAPAYQAPSYQDPVHQPLIPQPQVVTTTEFTNYMKANDAILKNMQTNMTSLTNSNLELKNMFGQFMKMNTTSSLGLETLPSNTITNPMKDLKVELETEVTKNTVPPTNNRSIKDVQPLIVQIETLIPNFEPVVAPVAAPVINFPTNRCRQRCLRKSWKVPFPGQFIVVDFNADPRVPLILGRSFLKIGKDLIDVYEGELTLRVGKEAITFNLD